MFYRLTLKKELEISPRFFGKKLYEEIDRSLRQEVEGSCDGDHGYIVAVSQVEEYGRGLIEEGVGVARFNVKYSCIAFLPHKGEVMDAVVKSVNKVRMGENNNFWIRERRRNPGVLIGKPLCLSLDELVILVK